MKLKFTPVALAAALALSACSMSPSDVTEALEEIAAASSHDIIAIAIGGYDDEREISARVFHRGATRGYEYVDGKVRDARGQAMISADSMGYPRVPGSWDVEAIMDAHPERCDGKRIKATALRRDTLVEVSCSARHVSTTIGDYEFRPIERWDSEEGIQTVLDETVLLTGGSVTALKWDDSTERDVTIHTRTGEGAEGECEGFIRRKLGELDTNYVSLGLCFDPPSSDAPQDIRFRVEKIDAGNLAAAMQVASEEAGLPTEDAKWVDVRTTNLPDDFVRTEPYLFMMWDDGDDNIAKFAVEIDTGKILTKEVFRDGELVED